MTQAEMCQEDKVGGRSHKRWLGADCQNWDTADDDGHDDGDDGDWDFDDGEGNIDDGDKETHPVF